MPKEWEQQIHHKAYLQHLKRVKEMKPSVKTDPPKPLPLSIKKDIEKKRELTRIEKGNRVLLDRLGLAMESKNIDNDQTTYFYHSLQAENRRRTLKRVQTENDRLLNRIRITEPVYNSMEWERQAEQRDKYLKNLTAYPDLFIPKFSGSKGYEKAEEFARAKSAKGSERLPSMIDSPEGSPFRNGLTRPFSASNLSSIEKSSR